MCVYKVHYVLCILFLFLALFLYLVTQLLYPVLVLCCDYNNINIIHALLQAFEKFSMQYTQSVSMKTTQYVIWKEHQRI